MLRLPDVEMDETFLNYLQRVFQHRKAVNPAYSIRAFARDLQIDQSLLSKFLKGKAEFNWKTIEHCLERLPVSPKVREHFRTLKHIYTSDFTSVDDSLITALGSWKHWAVLEYLKIDASPSFEDLGRKFGMSASEAGDTLASLIKLGFLEKTQERYKLLKPNNSWIDNDQTSQVKKKLQRELHELSLKSIDKVGADSRHHCSLTIALDSRRFPEFKEKLSSLLVEFAKSTQKANELNEVYQVTLGLFPLTAQE